MRWDKKDVPHKGWQSVGETDLREEDGRQPSGYAKCDMCGNTGVRFVHYMAHPEFWALFAVGRVCAANMVQEYVPAS